MKTLHRILLTAAITLPTLLPSLLHAQDATPPQEVHTLIVGPATGTPNSNVYTGTTTVNLTPPSPFTPGFNGTITSPNPVNSGILNIRVSPKLVKAAYLGVSISPTDQTLQAQLKLTQGTGLVVNNIDDKSPAETAGLQPNDIITLFADQIVINPDQFEVLVRSHKPGDAIELTIIRQAQPQKISVTLIEKEQPELAWVLSPHHSNFFSQPGATANGTGLLNFSTATTQPATVNSGTFYLQAPNPPATFHPNK